MTKWLSLILAIAYGVGWLAIIFDAWMPTPQQLASAAFFGAMYACLASSCRYETE